MQKGFLKRYCKVVYKEIIKYAKNYVREIIEEINVKSFTKYKYNFLCEFIGSFAFVFFISIYMLHSNSSEEYIITHSKQINPYDNNDIFISNQNFFENNMNNIMNSSEQYEQDISMEHVMLEKKILEIIKPTDTIEYDEDIFYIVQNKNKIKNDIESMKEIPFLDINRIQPQMNKIKINDENIQEEIKNRKEEKINIEPLIKEVENVTFKDHINEYSKIKISDINNIDIENIDKYEKLSNSKNIVNSHHSIYTIIGCLIYVTFVILGAHINPAYTYALWILEPKKYGFLLSTFYVGFQYLGGILASILIAHIYGSIFIYSLIPKKKVMKIFTCETLCTFILTMILINLYHYKKKFMKNSKQEKSSMSNFKPIKNMVSSSNIYDDFGSYEDIYNVSKKRKLLKLCIENRYVRYIMNHIFYLIFILTTLLFFIFVTNTSLNPMFTTSTLHTYLYFKLFQSQGSVNIYAFLKSFLSIRKIFQMILMYIYSLPFWIGPYVGSAFASFFILLLKEQKNHKEDEDINVIDSSIYKINKKKEKLPLLNTLNIKQNAYLVEYNNHIDQNINNIYMTPAVY